MQDFLESRHTYIFDGWKGKEISDVLPTPLWKNFCESFTGTKAFFLVFWFGLTMTDMCVV